MVEQFSYNFPFLLISKKGRNFRKSDTARNYARIYFGFRYDITGSFDIVLYILFLKLSSLLLAVLARVIQRNRGNGLQQTSLLN